MVRLLTATAATAAVAFAPAHVGPRQVRPRSVMMAVQPSRTARILHKVTFGLLGEEKVVEERPVFFDTQSAAPAPRSNNYGDELEMFMDDESLSKPKPTRKVLKAPSKINEDDGDEDDDEAPALKAPPRLETAMASEESIAKLNALMGLSTVSGSGVEGGKPEEEPEPAAAD